MQFNDVYFCVEILAMLKCKNIVKSMKDESCYSSIQMLYKNISLCRHIGKEDKPLHPLDRKGKIKEEWGKKVSQQIQKQECTKILLFHMT